MLVGPRFFFISAKYGNLILECAYFFISSIVETQCFNVFSIRNQSN